MGQGSLGDEVAAWPEVAQLRRNGSLLELRVQQHSEAQLARLSQAGLALRQCEPMSLEEIFVTTVRTQGVAA